MDGKAVRIWHGVLTELTAIEMGWQFRAIHEDSDVCFMKGWLPSSKNSVTLSKMALLDEFRDPKADSTFLACANMA
jgi:hypothetical protein